MLQIFSVSSATSTATFTAGPEGTFPRTLQWDRHKQILTVDLSNLPAKPTIFRAELILDPGDRFTERPMRPTSVYPLGHPDRKLRLVAPHFQSLDAREVVQEAVKLGQPLQLKVETILHGVRRLEVSYLEGKVNREKKWRVGGVTVLHRKGQSLVIFQEPRFAEWPNFQTGADVAEFKARLNRTHPGLTFRIWRSSEKINPATIARARLVGECSLFSAWNDGYHQDETRRQAPVRFRILDKGEPVPWGTGIYAHNPDKAGSAYYAVTVAVHGEEDLDSLGAGNIFQDPVEETVGPGEPILQWIERPDPKEGWLYRRGDIVRLIYTRWESWPHASRPNVPIDYLVVVPRTPLPKGPVPEPESRAFRSVGPAPVGLHLHCWGGSLNGGYGWWHNAQRGAVLIASNQIPYDWWTGYHEAAGTCKTYGDGHIQPFTINRLFGFLDWASQQHQEGPAMVREFWPKLDLHRVFTAGTSMGGSGAPMLTLRNGNRLAWGLGWVGIHVPELSPTFAGSYRNSYGPRHPALTMPDGKTSPWDYFSDVWWLRNHVGQDTGLVIASNGKNDGGIGWPQAWQFARALQETRRPHFFNWALDGHGTRTRIGSCFDLDVRADQSLPAFTQCSLDDNLGTAALKTREQIEAERQRQAAEVQAGKRREVVVDPFDGDSVGQYNAFLSWQTGDVLDRPGVWEMTVSLSRNAPRESCTLALTPRRCQKFRSPAGKAFRWLNTSLGDGKVIQSGRVTADSWGLITLEKLIVAKSGNRIRISRE